MELLRRIAAGRLSEVFGKNLVETDIFFSGLGIEESAAKDIEKLDKSKPSYILAKAYLDGINQFIENGPTPLEFYLVGLKKEKYALKDIYNVFGYMTVSFAKAHKIDPLLTEIKEKLGEEYALELINATNYNLLINTAEKQANTIKAQFSKSVATIMDKMPVPSLIGSNSWVLSPEKTKNGKVIFANDPHTGFAQPSIWYQNHIKTPNYELYGFNLALMPFPFLGHNKNYAYGITMLANDDMNFYIEQNNPNNPNEYKTPDGYKPYKTLTKTIKVKNAADTTYQIKVSHHGPIMNGLLKHLTEERPIAMHWIYTQLPNKSLESSYGISHAKSVTDFKETVAKIHAPGLNMMYGDAKDNIARFSCAKLYQLKKGLSSKLYLNGASGEEEITEFLSFEENPKEINPTKNYVYSANNQIDSIRGELYPGYYKPRDRAERIIQFLDKKNNFTKQDVATMLYDVTSPTTPNLAKQLLAEVDREKLNSSQKKAYDILQNWNGSYVKKAVAPTIYNRFLYEFSKSTYKDELGDSFELFIKNGQLQKEILPNQIARKHSVWWDDVTTTSTEIKSQIVNAAYNRMFTFLQNQLGKNVNNWTWNRVLSVEHEHAIGKAGSLLRKFFNVGPFETIGGNEVINNHVFTIDSTGYYKVTAGPSSRRVIDFSDIENSLCIIPTGQSGNRFSPFYKDQTQRYLEGKYAPMLLNWETIKNSSNKLIFEVENSDK